MVQKVKKKNIGIVYCVSLEAETQFIFVVIWDLGYTSSSDLDYKLSFSESNISRAALEAEHTIKGTLLLNDVKCC